MIALVFLNNCTVKPKSNSKKLDKYIERRIRVPRPIPPPKKKVYTFLVPVFFLFTEFLFKDNL